MQTLSNCFYLLSKAKIGELTYTREKIQKNILSLNDNIGSLDSNLDTLRKEYTDNLLKQYKVEDEHRKWEQEILIIKKIVNKKKKIEFLNKSLAEDNNVLTLIDLIIDKYNIDLTTEADYETGRN
jgi:hypothetical protein